MATWQLVQVCLLLFPLTRLGAALPERVEPALLGGGGLPEEACGRAEEVVGAASCDAQVEESESLSLRQLRGEPLRKVLAAEAEDHQHQQQHLAPEASERAVAKDVSLISTSVYETEPEVEEQQHQKKKEQKDVPKGVQPSGDLGLDVEADGFAPSWGLHTWTIMADTTTSSLAWDVVRVKFITTTGEELSPSTPGCHLVESGNAGPQFGPLNAFEDGDALWGGWKDVTSQKFYLGLTCGGNYRVAAVQLKQAAGDHSAHEVKVFHNQWKLQTKAMSSGWLQTVWAGSFGLRLVAKLSRSRSAWDVRRLKIVIGRDESAGFYGGELKVNRAHPFYCRAVESGHVDTPGYEAGNAFNDEGGWWGGRPGPARSMYIGIECDRPFAWPAAHSIYLDQPGEHYATEVELQQLTAFGWRTKDTAIVGPGGLESLA